MSTTPTAIPTEQQESAAILTALASYPDAQFKFNDNRIKLETGVAGDRNVMITALVATKNTAADTKTALSILKAVGSALASVDVDRVIVDVRAGSATFSTTSVVLYFAKKDVQEYATGKLTDAQMLARKEK